MYEDERKREAHLIVQGYEAYARDIAALWDSIRALFRFGSARRD